MSAAFPRHFLENDGGWRNVKLRLGKNCCQPMRVVRAEKNYKVNVVGQTRFAIKRCRHTAADKIADGHLIQRLCEQFDEIRFGHERKFGALPPRRAPVASRDAGFAEKRFYVCAPSSKGDAPRASVVPASSGGTLRTAPDWFVRLATRRSWDEITQPFGGPQAVIHFHTVTSL